MINLLSAGFSRLFRNMAFRIGTGIMMFLPVMAVLLNNADKTNPREPLDGVYYAGVCVVWLIIASFVSIFVGQDYNEKTMHNRLIAGHSRVSIYLADLIVTLTGAVIMQAAAIIAGSAVAIPLFGMYTEPVSTVIVTQLLIVCGMAVYTALVLFICTVVTTKSYAQGISMVVVLAMFIAGNSVYDNVQKLREKAAQENIPVTQLIPENSVKDTMYYALPTSQADVILRGGLPEKAGKMIAFDLASAALLTAAGMLVFRRKDIK